MGSIWQLEDIKEWAARKGRKLNLAALIPDAAQAGDQDQPAVQREP